VCAWEAAAITTGRLPTVSELCRRHEDLGPLIVTGLVIHLAEG
jgi:hypothetical protein